MSRYIDADALPISVAWIDQGSKQEHCAFVFEKDIKDAPTVDAVEVKHGHWEIAIGYDPKKAFQCSECRLMSYDPTEFCSHCGAKMDEVTE